jgi:hypothetical protein
MDAHTQAIAPRSFWREMRDGDHVCQVYEDEASFLDSLTGFIGHGLWKGEAVVVIATPAHVDGLQERLRASGLDLGHLRADDRFITLSAETTLSQFLVEGWPDAALFEATLMPVIERARRADRPVRGFGEMVALLWERRQYAATVRLEHLWQKLATRERLQVLCSYPKRSYLRAPETSRAGIVAEHSFAVAG